MCNLDVFDVESVALCPLEGLGGPGGPEHSDADPGSEEVEEGREPKVERDPRPPQTRSASGTSAFAYRSGRGARVAYGGWCRMSPTQVISRASILRPRPRWTIASSPRAAMMRPWQP
eukprot:12164616-Alexandrium_andersonii.AAC.2